MVDCQQVSADDRFGLAFPFAHIGGVSNLAVALSSGCTLVIAEVFDDGWFHTGDVGYLDAEGHVTLTGRVKDIIIRKGLWLEGLGDGVDGETG